MIERKAVRVLFLAVGIVLLSGLSFASIVIGARHIDMAVAIEAFRAYDPTAQAHIIVRDYRLPRTLLAIMCGAAFGVSGALIQVATRNPLADPGILGVNAGAAFMVTLAIGLWGFHSIDVYLWFALFGAIIVTLAVYVLGTSGRHAATPVRLVLAGVALAAVLGGIGSAITLLDPQAFDSMRTWSIGSVAGRDMQVVYTVMPIIAIGLVLALFMARPLNAVAMGDDLAKTLGVGVARTRILTVAAVTLLAGGGTAAVGPIGFVGLMVPHVVRWFSGPDQRWIMVLTIIYAPVLLLAADIIGRLVLYPGELEAGIVTAFVGAPVLIMLVRRKKASGL